MARSKISPAMSVARTSTIPSAPTARPWPDHAAHCHMPLRQSEDHRQRCRTAGPCLFLFGMPETKRQLVLLHGILPRRRSHRDRRQAQDLAAHNLFRQTARRFLLSKLRRHGLCPPWRVAWHRRHQHRLLRRSRFRAPAKTLLVIPPPWLARPAGSNRNGRNAVTYRPSIRHANSTVPTSRITASHGGNSACCCTDVTRYAPFARSPIQSPPKVRLSGVTRRMLGNP